MKSYLLILICLLNGFGAPLTQPSTAEVAQQLREAELKLTVARVTGIFHFTVSIEEITRIWALEREARELRAEYQACKEMDSQLERQAVIDAATQRDDPELFKLQQRLREILRNWSN
jgi:hypothetical protein